MYIYAKHNDNALSIIINIIPNTIVCAIQFPLSIITRVKLLIASKALLVASLRLDEQPSYITLFDWLSHTYTQRLFPDVYGTMWKFAFNTKLLPTFFEISKLMCFAFGNLGPAYPT